MVLMGLLVCVAVLAALLQKQAPVFAFLLSIAAALFLMLRLAAMAQTFVQGILLLGRRTDGQAFDCLMRCAGILLLTDYARQLCEEAGAQSLGWCAGLMGRCLVLVSAWPLLQTVCQKIWGMTG